ncbi:TIGR02996 domain-containing protein [Zavarzinella formosa]|uniref:TIGR02996 domain-containing protein n=1 Tax=Zavarzinella formosa TaxID=360055 RepID=UPI00030BD1A9|nr:TIGR02996 domain-containing protein [Zavarzinella formosa]
MTPMHPEQAALWETIRENPHDDAPRLIYADWLEENDDPDRAEFIRRQVDDAQMEACGGIDDRFVENRLRCRELFQTHQRKWWTPLHKFLDDTDFVRGFPSPRFDSRHFRSFIQLARYYQWTIPEWRLLMESGVSRLLEYASQPCFRMAVSLELISDIPNPAILKPYLNAPNLLNIWSLTLGMDRIRTGHLEVMMDSPLPDQLREFAIRRESAINFSHLRGAMRRAGFSSLRSLTLVNQQIIDEVLWQIDECIPLRRLRSLDLSHNLLGKGAVACMSASGEDSALSALNLSGNQLDDEAAAVISGTSNLSNLTSLDLSHNQISREGLMALAESPRLPRLRSLNWSGNPGATDAETGARLTRRFPGLGLIG